MVSKTVLITGALGGLGKQLNEGIRVNGWKVIALTLSPRLYQKEFRNEGVTLHYNGCELR